MKKLLLLALSSILLFSTRQANAQTIDFVFTITNASSDTSCDGELDLQCIGCPPATTYAWHAITGNVIIGTSNHINGLCVNNTYCYTLVIEFSPGVGCMFSGSVKDATLFDSTFQLATSLKTAPNDWDSGYWTDTYMEIQQISGGNSPYLYYLYDSYGALDSDPYPLYIDSNLTSVSNIVFDSLYDGYMEDFTLVVGDASQNTIGYYFSLLLDTALCYQCPIPLWASAQGYPVSDSSVCDGTAYVAVYGGTPPYTYQFSSGSTDSTQTGLCPGSYIVTVRDADSNIYNTTFVVGYPGTIYFSDPGSLNYIDTLYSNAYQECGLDYSMPIDSFYIDSSYAVSNWEYVIEWMVVQDTNEYSVTETYYFDSVGAYMFGLSVYCDARSFFGSYTLFAGLNVTQLSAQVVEKTKDSKPMLIYPNPSNGIYQLKSSSKMKEYTIYDQLGRMVAHKRLNSDNETVNISELHNGVYYFVVQFQDGSIGKQKLVKK